MATWPFWVDCSLYAGGQTQINFWELTPSGGRVAEHLNFRRTLTVFIGSPGGLADERNAVQATVEEMNRLVAHRAGYHLDVVRWEDSVPGFGNPQERLNQELDRSDLFIGMLNRSWGSPPAGSSDATSGFEEEYRRSLKRRQASGYPEMMVFFQTVPDDLLRDAGPDLQKVIAFRQELDNAKPIFYKVFEGVPDLQLQLRGYLSAWLHSLGEVESLALREDVAEPATTPANARSGHLPVFSDQGAAFLTAIAKADRENGMLSSAEVARVRLLGLLSHTSSNDARALGVHDANLLYSDYPASHFGEDEVRGLISAGLDHYASKTAPLWTWLVRGPDAPARQLTNAAMLKARPTEQAGAIAALQLIGGELASALFTRDEVVEHLLDESENRDVRSAMFRYLVELGVEGDLPALWAAHTNSAAGQIDEIDGAILAILSRVDRIKAFRALLDLSPSSPTAAVVSEIFTVADAVSPDWIVEALGHRSAQVRLAAIEAKNRLSKGEMEWARALTRDADPDVRAAAVSALEDAGEVLSPDDVRGILVRSNRNALLWFSSPATLSGTAQWAAYRRRSIWRWNEEQQKRATTRDKDAAAFLALSGVSDKPNVLREIVDSRGGVNVEIFDNSLAQQSWPPTEEHVLALYVQAIEALAVLKDVQDLERIRTAFADARVELPEAAYAYLGVVGDWGDANRIVQATSERRGVPPPTLLSIGDRRAEYGWAAAALIALSKGDWLQLLALNPVPAVLARLILEMPQKAWVGVENDLLLQLFANSDANVREVSALRCIRDLPIKRIKSVFNYYNANIESRYYSVVHWLDFGMVAPRSLTVPASRRRLDRIRQTGGLMYR